MKKLLKKINSTKLIESPGKLLGMVPHSVRDKFEKVSSVRIQAYLLFGVIIGFAMFFLGIELTSAIIAWVKTGTYALSSEILIIFGALLTHHIALLFNKRKEYTKEEKITDLPSISGLSSEKFGKNDKPKNDEPKNDEPKKEENEEVKISKPKVVKNPVTPPDPKKKVIKTTNPLNDMG